MISMLMMTSAVGFASSESTFALAESDRATSSSSLDSSSSSCYDKWGASEDYVVWKFVVDNQDDDDDVKITDFDIEFEHPSSVKADKVKGENLYVKTDRHTRLIDAAVTVRADDDDDEETEHRLRLAGVCYQGAGPTPDITFIFQAVVCNSFSAVAGNQVDTQSSWWDMTSGAWEGWQVIYTSNAPLVHKLNSPPSGCEWENGQKFSMGTSSSMADGWKVPGATAKNGHGHLTVSSDDLPDHIKRSLADKDGEVWFQRTNKGGVELGSFKCHNDSLHADDVEFINSTPAPGTTVVCISYAVGA